MYNTVTFSGREGLERKFSPLLFVFEGYLLFVEFLIVFPLDDKAVLNMRQSDLGELLCISCLGSFRS